MTKLHPLILPDKPSPYGPATKSGDDDPDEADQDQGDSETTDSEDGGQ